MHIAGTTTSAEIVSTEFDFQHFSLYLPNIAANNILSITPLGSYNIKKFVANYLV